MEEGQAKASFWARFKMSVLGLIMLVAGWVGQDVYGWVRDKLIPPEDVVGQLAEKQQAGFEALNASLDQLRRAVDGDGKAALREVVAASESLERLNRDVLAKLRFAELENRSLQRNLQAAGGATGGYDFLLAPGETMRIDGANVLGLERISGGRVWVNFSSTSDAGVDTRAALSAGESVAFRNAQGQGCKATLASVREGVEVASFAIVCGASA